MKIRIIIFFLLATIGFSSCISLVANYAGKRFEKRMEEAEKNPSTISYSDTSMCIKLEESLPMRCINEWIALR